MGGILKRDGNIVMKIHKSYKVELAPNNKQKTYLEKSFGCARFAYNWGLAQRIGLHKLSKKSLSFIDQQNELNKIKRSQYPWMYEISKCIPHGSLRNLDTTFKNFFRGIKQGRKIGFPKFKSKHNSRQSFDIQNIYFKVTETHIKLPYCSQIKLKEKNYIPLNNIKYNSVIITTEAGKYFASVQCEINIFKTQKPQEIIGIDLGIKTLATCSNGTVFENSNCGSIKKDLKLSDRIYYCDTCNNTIDRDLKAAINLKNYYITKNTVSSTEIKACGENVRPSLEVLSGAVSLKQEKSGDLILCQRI